jgi:hypothetical protein
MMTCPRCGNPAILMASEEFRLLDCEFRGWSAGLVRTFAPEARQPGRNAAIDGVLAAMFTSGAVLTCKAYRPAIGQR